MILVTGATGFVGNALVKELANARRPVRACVRAGKAVMTDGISTVRIKGIDANQDWRPALDGVSVIVHAAARVHVMNDTAKDPLVEFRRVNVEGTLNLARQAAAAGVTRFVFISSIKVNGESTEYGRPFYAEDAPAPIDPYGLSKLEAEIGLSEIGRESGMEIVVIRPPLVYGPGVKANFLSMMKILDRRVPLPLGAVHNARSLVSIGNLVSLIVVCIDHPAAANETFLASDGEDLSTTQLLMRMADALGRRARLIPVPMALLRLGAAVLGKPNVAQRLCGSLQVDISKTRKLLAWNPPFSVDEGLRMAVEGYRRETRS